MKNYITHFELLSLSESTHVVKFTICRWIFDSSNCLYLVRIQPHQSFFCS